MKTVTTIALIGENNEWPADLPVALSKTKNINVYGVYDSFRIAKKELLIHSVEIVILFIQHTQENSFEFIERLLKINKNMRVILISEEYEHSYLIASIQIGVIGFLQNDSTSEEIVKAIMCVINGGAPIAPQMAMVILMDIKSRYHKELEIRNRLTDREEEICIRLADGLSNKEIGKLLCISPHTVNHHLRSIYKKLKVKNRSGS